jgi:hypothetical protein
MFEITKKEEAIATVRAGSVEIQLTSEPTVGITNES